MKTNNQQHQHISKHWSNREKSWYIHLNKLKRLHLQCKQNGIKENRVKLCGQIVFFSVLVNHSVVECVVNILVFFGDDTIIIKWWWRHSGARLMKMMMVWNVLFNSLLFFFLSFPFFFSYLNRNILFLHFCSKLTEYQIKK